MIGWLDCQAGVSGDMLLGALVDVGVPVEVMQEEVSRLADWLELVVSPTTRAGLAATKVTVQVRGVDAEQAGDVHRTWGDVRALLDRLEHAELPH